MVMLKILMYVILKSVVIIVACIAWYKFQTSV